MGFKTKLDFSNNRQVKQRVETTTVLSGATYFGVPFSELPSGVDVTNTGITETQTNLLSTFSGNSATTVFNWFDSRMSIAEPYFSAITPSISAETQNSGNVFVVSNSTTIDGNTVNLEYTGVSFDISTFVIYDLGGGAYSGTVTTDNLDIISGGTIDFTGRTIWVDVSGITRTEQLIISKNPTIGYVWTCIDTEGNGEWQFNSSATTATIWTAGTGTNSAVLAGSDGIGSGFYSVTEGYLNTASNYASHAEGRNTIASGIASHSEGSGTTAIGDYSHAEGIGTSAYGKHSHSEGFGTLAFGKGSHAEGGSYDDNLSGGTASGNGSHAEGGNTIASGLFSHAEGSVSVASGNFSHAEGASTIASGDYSHAEGAATIASGDSSHAGGYQTQASGYASHAEGGNTVASGDYSHAEGFSDSNGQSIASGLAAHAEGGSQATNNYSHGQNYGNIASGTYSHAGGYANEAKGDVSFSHFYGQIGSILEYGVSGDTSAILGGSFHKILTNANDSGIFAGYQNEIIGGVNRSVILGGQNITATTSDTVYMNNLSVQNTNGNFYSNVNGTTENSCVLSGGSNTLSFLESKTIDNSSVRIGVRGASMSPLTFDEYGKVNDSFLYSSINNNGLNIISAPGVTGTEDYIRFYAGQNAELANTPDIHIQGTGSTRGFVGFGTESPSEKLDVSGNTKISGTLNIGTVNAGTIVNNLGIDSSGNVIEGVTTGTFLAGKAPEPITTHSLTVKGIPDGQVISGYTSIYYNNTDISGTLTTPFGTFDNTTGIFTVNVDCVLNIQAWIHLKANTSATLEWETGTTVTQIGLGICPNNTTDIYVGDFLTVLPSVQRALPLTTGITQRVTSGSTFRVKVLNQTTRAYAGSGSVGGDYMRFSITRIA